MDSDFSTVAWYVNGVCAGSGVALDVGFLNHDSVTCEVTPDDGVEVFAAQPSPSLAVGAVKMLSAGYSATCLLSAYGKVACWGDNSKGQLEVVDNTYVSVGTGAFHACGLTDDGEILCWGVTGSINSGTGVDYGQVSEAPSDPAQTFVALAVGPFTNCAITSDGERLCWGDDGYDMVSEVPATEFIAVDVTDYHACGLTSAGTVECWGDNAFNQLIRGVLRPLRPSPWDGPHLCVGRRRNGAMHWLERGTAM